MFSYPHNAGKIVLCGSSILCLWNHHNMKAEDSILPEVINIGRSTFDPIYAEREHRSASSELIHILQGKVTVKTRQYSISASVGETIYTPANVLHRDIFPPDLNFEIYFFQFRWEYERKLLREFSPVQLNSTSKATKQKLAELCHRIYEEFISGLPHSKELVSLYLLEILYILRREASILNDMRNMDNEDISKSRRAQIMKDAKEFIQRNFNRPISLEDIAEALDISPYYLSRIFSRESGFTLSSYLTRVRIERAVELMKDNRLNISEIAHSVGYKDSHYFSKVFKLYFNSSPKAYRAALITHLKGN